MTEKEVTDTIIAVMREWPRHNESAVYWAVPLPLVEGGWSLGYRRDPHRYFSGLHWDANIRGDIFYLLSIELPEEMRGQGLGTRLYALVEKIAGSLGCKQIRQTPSGWTKTGEERCDYLIRRGWLPDSGEVYKMLDEALMNNANS